jgi:tripartite-type tricarboxylate transporter receptor subunit TctC
MSKGADVNSCLALLASLVCTLALAIVPARAQTAAAYPERTIRIIVPFPAGGATDIVARMLGERLAGAWGKPVIIENVSGAAGATGTAAGAKAAPDGYSLLVATGTTTTLLPHLRSNLPYNPLRDFEAVTLICSFPNILVVRPDLSARDVRELIALLQANPGKFSYASSGYGASPHLSAEWFKLLTRTDILHVPFTGSGPAQPALLGGHVDMMFDTMPSIWPLVQDGKLRALAVTTAERVPFVAELPALSELLPGYDVTSWLGIMVPAGTPAEIRTKLSDQLQQIVKDPVIVQRLREFGAFVTSQAPNEFTTYVERDYRKWERVTRELGIRQSN